MKTKVLIALISYARAQQNIDDNVDGVPNWVEIDLDDLRQPQDRSLWPTCNSNSECEEGYVCAEHLWEYNG